MSPCSIRSEGLLPPKHHPQTATIVGPKDRIPTEGLAVVVYQVPCAIVVPPFI